MIKLRNKKDSGGLLLELLFMIAILLIIFPIVQNNVSKRTNEIRNKMVVKDMMRIKLAVENMIKRKPDSFSVADGEDVNMFDLNLSDLLEDGLSETVNEKSILGQHYKVRVKVSKDNDTGNLTYDAVVLALGKDAPDLSDMRIKNIVKEAKGFAGYVDVGENLIYGPTWQLTLSDWNKEGIDVIDTSSIIVKTGFSKKDYEYISRVQGIGSSTMETDLYMSLRSINNIRNMYTTIIEVKTFDGSGVSDVSNIGVESKFDIQGDINVTDAINFPNGFQGQNFSFVDDEIANVFLETILDVAGSLFFVGEDEYNILRYVDTTVLEVSDSSISSNIMSIGNLLSFPLSDEKLVTVQSIIVDTYNSDKNVSDDIALRFKSIKSKTDPRYYLENANFNGYDLVVRNVNKKLMLLDSRIGGIAINEETPISVILRALHYAHADINKIIKNEYPEGSEVLVPGWVYNLYLRCEFNECTDTGWYQ